MSAFENPKLSTLTISGVDRKIYSKGVDKNSSSPITDLTGLTGATWTLSGSSDDWTLNWDAHSFGADAGSKFIEIPENTKIQLNTAPLGYHPGNWQLEVYMSDGSVEHTQGGSQWFLLNDGLPSGAVFAELMLGKVPSNSQDTTVQTETLAYFAISGSQTTELFYVDTSDSQDGSAFGLLLDQAGQPLTREQIEGGQIDVHAVQVAEVDYQARPDLHDHEYPAPTTTTDFVELGFIPAPPIGPAG